MDENNNIEHLLDEVFNEVRKARELLNGYAYVTPLVRSKWLSSLTGADVHLKLESEQRTGSFKFRGAMNKILSSSARERERGFVTASTGNHGKAVAEALEVAGLTTSGSQNSIFLPEKVSSGKLLALSSYTVNIEFTSGSDCLETERAAVDAAKQSDRVYISPYTDLSVCAGQGTIACELVQQLPTIDAVFICVGGGGMIGGIASYFRKLSPGTTIVGCQPEASAVMSESVKAGRILDLPSLPTLSDGSAGGLDDGGFTFDLCKTLVDEWVLVSEEEIATAVLGMIQHHSKIVEGAAAVAIAALLKTCKQTKDYAGKSVVAVVCGSNLGTENLRSVLSLGADGSSL
ncbi:hypothetical protein NDN08_005735 [Rhodosorus marinus]|uniref:Tryptophan synthase beta chain-like PALP domain-containing protein n=1 Tax=Rhodosorus marinus TaxID=101924 RepID=A0AAV8V4W4_9RHOD|nr:hypothetical protein NDN08_005735 [Rhodosorus marinus]